MIDLNTGDARYDMRQKVGQALFIDKDRFEPSGDLGPRLDALIDAAAETVNRRAPDAPQSVATEALIRMAAWLFETSGANVEISQAGAFRRCGAASLLGPWTVRRAGAVART